RVVLSPQIWQVSAKEISELRGEDEQIAEWCRRRKLPRFVRVSREMAVDLESAIGRASIAELRSGGVLTELIPEPEELWLGGERPFVHELLIPYRSTAEPVRKNATRATATPGQRVFVPGSEWLYARLYTGHSGVDRLLTGPIDQLVDELTQEGAIDRWFFLRYADPDPEWHLRV